MTRYFRTVYQVEVLSEDTPADNLSISEIAEAVTDGDCSGDLTVVSVEEKTGPEIVQLLLAQGSAPEFFGLDETGIQAWEQEDRAILADEDRRSIQ